MSDAVFVCGATGTQGGAVARHLRMANIPVHSLVRNPSSDKAKGLRDIGVTIFPGSYEDADALRVALKGTRSAFLNFLPTFTDFGQELRDAKAVIAAARDAGVEHVAYSGVFGIDTAKAPPSIYDPNGLVATIVQAKRDIVTEVVSAGFASYTILRPAKFMSDLFGPAVAWFGDLSRTGIFETALKEGTPGPWVDPDDIGALGAAALTDAEKFSGQTVDVYTELLTTEMVIEMLAAATGKKLSVRFLSEPEIEERMKKGDVFIQAQAALMRDSYESASMERVTVWGVPLGSFQNFLDREKASLMETYAQVPDKE